MKRLCSFFTATVTAAFAMSCAAFADLSAVDKAQQTVDGIIGYELEKTGSGNVQEWIDGEITANAGKSSEWFAIALSGSGEYDFSGYRAALEQYISTTEVKSATTRMKNALALLAVGGNRKLADEAAESSVGNQGIMSLIYGLHLLNNGCSCSRYTADMLTDELLSMQFDDGGWAIMGENGDIDVTAMTVQALAPQYDSDDTVHNSVERALAFLSGKQQENGGYVSFGTPNLESAAQVLIAVSSVGLDISDPRFVKNGNDLISGILQYRLEDGSFCHSEGSDTNDTATIQALLSLTAYTIMQNGGQRLYDFPVQKASEPAQTAEETLPPVTVPVETASAAPVTEPESTAVAAQSASYKPAAYCIIGGAALVACIVLFLLKKRRMSNFIAVFIVGGAAAAFVFFTDFRSSEDYYSGTVVHKDNATGTVTMSIRCDTVVGRSDSPYVPADGVILAPTEFEIADGDTAYDILTEAAKRYNLQLQVNGTYIAGIAYLYEYDYGDLSGWIYHVNGDSPFVMCSDYKLSDGDVIEWLYTCELGNDL